MIVDATTSVDMPMDTFIMLGLIQLEFIRFHEPIVVWIYIKSRRERRALNPIFSVII
jgi:hypothetical protein